MVPDSWAPSAMIPMLGEPLRLSICSTCCPEEGAHCHAIWSTAVHAGLAPTGLQSMAVRPPPGYCPASDAAGPSHSLFLGLQVIAVKAPGFGERKSSYLEDIAILTGAQVVKEELGLQLDKVSLCTCV